MGVERPGPAHRLVVPDVAQELRLREHPPRLATPAPAAARTPCSRATIRSPSTRTSRREESIERSPTRIGPGALLGAAPQDRAHPGRELRVVERLRHVVVGALLEPADAVDLAPAAAQDDHRQPRVVAAGRSLGARGSRAGRRGPDASGRSRSSKSRSGLRYWQWRSASAAAGRRRRLEAVRPEVVAEELERRRRRPRRRPRRRAARSSGSIRRPFVGVGHDRANNPGRAVRPPLGDRETEPFRRRWCKPSFRRYRGWWRATRHFGKDARARFERRPRSAAGRSEKKEESGEGHPPGQLRIRLGLRPRVRRAPVLLQRAGLRAAGRAGRREARLRRARPRRATSSTTCSSSR